MTSLDSRLSLSHLVGKLMEIRSILIRICLKWFANDSEMLFNDFDMLCVMILKGCVNDFEMNFNDLSSSSKRYGSEKTYKGL